MTLENPLKHDEVDHHSRSLRNFFTAHHFNRVAVRRRDGSWLQTQLKAPQTRILPLWNLKSLFTLTEPPQPILLAPAEFQGLVSLTPETAILLGEENDTIYFAVDIPPNNKAAVRHLSQRGQFEALRKFGPSLAPHEGALLALARGMVYWQEQHRYCGVCGHHTISTEGGYVRACTNPACGQKIFPRTDPAIITLVHQLQHDTDRCLLGRQPHWPPGMFSTIAGFVEPGETLEAAVIREVQEETGIQLDRIYYHSSQPWPFPSSLMMGYIAQASSSTIHLNDDELEKARWFSRAELVAGLKAGTVSIPGELSISHRLIESWFNAASQQPLSKVLAELA